MISRIIILEVLFSMFILIIGKNYRRVCYFTNWARWRNGIGKFTAADVDPFLCTHIIFAFANFESDGLIMPQEPGQDEQDYKAFVNMKQQNKNLKVLLAFGGWNFGSQRFSNMVTTPSVRLKFIYSALLFLRKYGFDGLDLDWEYPAIRGGSPSDKENFVTLCRDLNAAFTSEAIIRGKERLLLTAAVPCERNKASVGYDVSALSMYLDFINLMTYNFHGGWEGKTGFNSPLYGSVSSAGQNDNMDAAARWWYEAGMPKNKITIGMATFGRSFTLNNPHDHGVGVTASVGPASQVCQELEQAGGMVIFDDVQKVPYYVKDSLWLSYDNELSFKIKAEWVKSNDYGGVMFWALDLDDFKQTCRSSRRKYPLIQTVNDVLTNNNTVIKDKGCHIVSEPFTCDGRPFGVYPDETNCSKFYICTQFGNFWMSCPVTFAWDPITKDCIQQSKVHHCSCTDQ